LDIFGGSDLTTQAHIVLRLLLAYVLCAAIGWERERAQRPAGLRTHILVGVGAAGFTIISIYGFDGFGTVRDPARVAAQIIAGIGFLGAGAIWRNDSRVGGLTTAASIWVVAAIGMMAGTGMWFAAVFITLLSWFTLHIVKAVDHNRHLLKRPAHFGEPSIMPDTIYDEDESELVS
jgi:putative Mg2+ transporter-C (MgtC) family protein